MEIVDTDNPTYKRPLKHQREVIDTIVGKLQAATTHNPNATSADTDATDLGRVSLRVVAVW